MRIALLAGLGLGWTGCDDPATRLPPPDKAPATKPNAAPAHPTTQALLDEPRLTTSLTPLPITIDLPTSWKIHDPNAQPKDKDDVPIIVPQLPDDGLTVSVEGPMPRGDGMIRFSAPVPKGVAIKELSTEALLKRQPEYEKKGGALTVRHQGKVIYVERRMPGLPSPEFDDPSYDWSMTIYAPAGDHLAVYQVTFLGLTLSEYNASEKFLRPMIDSIHLTTTP